MIVGSPKTIVNELEIIEAKIYSENSSYLYLYEIILE